ncbi:S-adenosylmethionine decarboxylase [Hymenobacter sp. M29]|uniref:S-adenosylmethionine decarboxylase n=1 Tax=Hymenobacter mellowenesis TaxID=3063995 RepID=A0ABT9ABA7_9BACT|nr:S-adenosylmethionine decarboxylase [Hymenobacter sp. M29]MDO7846470.1 S-adenosylmethionine decarboxylase [Hymenobacter sp. M29]
MTPKIWNHSLWIPQASPSKLRPLFDALLAGATFSVLNFTEYHFRPYGWTALWLLGESHLAIHTFPDYGTAYVELSSCMLDKYVHFVTALEQWVSAQPPAEPLLPCVTLPAPESMASYSRPYTQPDLPLSVTA